MAHNIWDRLTDKRQLVMRGRTDNEVAWRLNITPIGLWGGIVGLIIIIFITLLLLMSYTSKIGRAHV